MLVRLSAAAVVAALAIAAPAVAAPTYFTDYVAFATSAAAPFSFESFETLLASGPYSLTFAATTVTFDTVGFGYDATLATDGTHSIFNYGLTRPTFNFAAPVTAFGIDILDLGTVGPQDLYIALDNATPFLLRSNFEGGDLNQTFAGVIDADGFSTVTFSTTRPGDNVVYDLQRTIAYVATPPVGGVPEPTTWALLLTGFGAVGAAVRGRRATAVAA